MPTHHANADMSGSAMKMVYVSTPPRAIQADMLLKVHWTGAVQAQQGAGGSSGHTNSKLSASAALL